MTAVSLPSFFNVIPHANGLEQISGGDTNMFRLAKEQGYETYFYSAQAENQMAILNLIGKKWIDHLIQPTQLGYGNGDNMPDEKLLPLFDKINLQQGRHFIVLHQRGSHAPYGALLQPQDKVFGEADIADKYDNTIHKTDQMIQTVFEQLQSSLTATGCLPIPPIIPVCAPRYLQSRHGAARQLYCASGFVQPG